MCIVDDDESIRRSFTRLFRSVRMPAEAFASAQAIWIVQSTRVRRCLVLDVQMPELDGLELQHALPNRDVEIVFVTGHGASRCAPRR